MKRRRRKNQLKVKVLQRGGKQDRRAVIERAARWMAPQIMGARLANTLSLTIELRQVKGLEEGEGGAAFNPVNGSRTTKKFRIVIRRDNDFHKQLETLAHELTHVEQFARNRLQYNLRVDGQCWVRWNGDDMGPYGSIPYFLRPWEVEAFDRAPKVRQAYIEYLRTQDDDDYEVQRFVEWQKAACRD